MALPAPAQHVTITADANSRSWVMQQSRVQRLLDDFVAQNEPERCDGVRTWKELREPVVCGCKFYEDLAGWLVKVYKIPAGCKNAGMPLACDTVRNYLGTALQSAEARFKESTRVETQTFLMCLDAGSRSEPAQWLRKLKTKVQRITFMRAKEAGEQLDKSEVPLYLKHVMRVNGAYSRAGTREAAARKLAILTCQRAAGRSAEPAWMSFDGMQWDAHFRHVFMESPQPKGSKVKLVALGAGESRHSDWFLALGDYLTLYDFPVYKEDAPNWFLPFLQETSSPGTTLSNFIKAVQTGERGGHSTYGKVALPGSDLPARVTAGGLRPGACNELRAAMPTEHAMHVTAHDMTPHSAFFEYIDCTRAGCMPGSVVLGGWDALPWGQMGMGPVPPSIDVVVERGGSSGGLVDVVALENCIDHLFRIDKAAAPMLMREGHLRPMVHAAFASLVMYFDERRGANEMGIVLSRMCDCLQRFGLSEGAAPVVLTRWGVALKHKFDFDNLFLRGRSADTGIVQVVAALHSLGRTVSGLHSTLGALERKVSGLLSAAPPSTPSPPHLSRWSSDTLSSSRSGSASAALPAPDDTALALQGDGAGDALPPPPLPPSPNAFSGLLPASNADIVHTLTSRNAQNVWIELMSKNGGYLPNRWSTKQEKNKAKILLEWFNAMATEEEKSSMKAKDDGTGTRRIIAARVHGALLARLREFYAASPLQAPRDMTKQDHQLRASAISSHVEKLTAYCGKGVVVVSGFATWRKAWEAARNEEAASSVAPPKKKPRNI